jgi:polyisoprenyl-teichoic acid--peptidoglycan teichoic acid transferase
MRLRLVAAALLLAGCASVSPSPSPSIEVTPSPSPTAVPSPTPIPIDQAMLARRFTVLVVGADSNQARRARGEDVNTDALMVVSVSADKSRIAMLSLPRDTVDIPMPDGSIYHGKVNAIAQRLGIEALRGAMATLIGVPIDRYIRVDMDDFQWLVDAVDGIDVEVKTRIADSQVHLFLDPGPAHLDGAQALSFSRSRADSDYARAGRQQQVILALARKWLDPGLAALLEMARLRDSLETDIGADELPTLLEIGRRSATAEVTGAVLQPPRFSLFVGIEPNSIRGWVMIPNVPEIRAYAGSLIFD